MLTTHAMSKIKLLFILGLSPQPSYHPFCSRTLIRRHLHTLSPLPSPHSFLKPPWPGFPSPSHSRAVLLASQRSSPWLSPHSSSSPLCPDPQQLPDAGSHSPLKPLNVRCHKGSGLRLHWVSVQWRYNARHGCDFKLSSSYPKGVTRNR